MSKILILCTGNSCRSQMAEGYLKSLDSSLQVFSAGTVPAQEVNRFAVKAMAEIGIDISNQVTTLVYDYIYDEFDFVITVCDKARRECPVFAGKVNKRLHIGFEDPADAVGTEEEVMPVYRKVRDEIAAAFKDFYYKELKP